MDDQKALENVIATLAIEDIHLGEDDINMLKKVQDGKMSADECIDIALRKAKMLE